MRRYEMAEAAATPSAAVLRSLGSGPDRQIRRFMVTFGPLSSLFDFLTFAVLLAGLGAGAAEFRTGWFVESLATQTLVVFVIRTRRPAWRSRPHPALAARVPAAGRGPPLRYPN